MLAAPRVAVATDLHAGLTRLLAEHDALFERIGFQNEIEHIVVCAALDGCLLMLREHADHEDIVVAPIVAELDGNLAREARRQHQALEQRARDVERTCSRLRFSASYEWAALGRELCHRFEALTEAQRAHMAFEESEVQTLLWSEKNDEELLGMRAAVHSLLTPARRWAWHVLLSPGAAAAGPGARAPHPEPPVPLVA